MCRKQLMFFCFIYFVCHALPGIQSGKVVAKKKKKKIQKYIKITFCHNFLTFFFVSPCLKVIRQERFVHVPSGNIRT